MYNKSSTLGKNLLRKLENYNIEQDPNRNVVQIL